MSEEKKKAPAELNDELLDGVAGGFAERPQPKGIVDWFEDGICPKCGAVRYRVVMTVNDGSEMVHYECGGHCGWIGS